MAFSENEKKGIAELLLNEENTPTLIQIARGLIKNVKEISSGKDALDIVFTHGGDSYTLLSKRSITKEILFKYLNNHQVPIEMSLTKAMLISKILNYWRGTSQNKTNNCDTPTTIPSANIIAKAFAEWFFKKYNSNELLEVDFWPDAHLSLRIIANDATEESVGNSAKDILMVLMSKKAQFNFYFNLNISETGVQGRMDAHGMLLALTCGTLHTQETCVGVFECFFGLLRDPFDNNNWKIKTLRCLLRSQESSEIPTLIESESLQEALAISQDSEDHG